MRVFKIKDIEAVITYKKMKNIRIHVTPPDGAVSVSAPHGTPDEKLQTFLESSYDWIIKSKEKILVYTRNTNKNYLDTVYLFGKPYSVETVMASKFHVYTNENTICIYTDTELDLTQTEKIIKEWKRIEFKKRLPSLIAECELTAKLHANEWRIKDMKTKWGTCNSGYRRIWLRLELASYPEECIKSVMLHELAHLIEANHSKRFYALLHSFCPQYDQLHAILDQHKYSLN